MKTLKNYFNATVKAAAITAAGILMATSPAEALEIGQKGTTSEIQSELAKEGKVTVASFVRAFVAINQERVFRVPQRIEANVNTGEWNMLIGNKAGSEFMAQIKGVKVRLHDYRFDTSYPASSLSFDRKKSEALIKAGQPNVKGYGLIFHDDAIDTIYNTHGLKLAIRGFSLDKNGNPTHLAEIFAQANNNDAIVLLTTPEGVSKMFSSGGNFSFSKDVLAFLDKKRAGEYANKKPAPANPEIQKASL